jgi:hypothetical protein
MPGCGFRHFGEIPRPEGRPGERCGNTGGGEATTRPGHAGDGSNTRIIGSFRAIVHPLGGAVWSSDVRLARRRDPAVSD